MKLFKLMALVIGNKPDLDGEISIKFHVVYIIGIWVDIKQMQTSNPTKCSTSIVIF